MGLRDPQVRAESALAPLGLGCCGWAGVVEGAEQRDGAPMGVILGEI